MIAFSRITNAMPSVYLIVNKRCYRKKRGKQNISGASCQNSVITITFVVTLTQPGKVSV